MVASLNDKYTRFVDPKEFEEEKNMIKGSLCGIGIQMGLRDGKILVISPIEDTPGEKAGLLAEDEILAIDGVSGNDFLMMDPGSDATILWQEYNWTTTIEYAYYEVVE